MIRIFIKTASALEPRDLAIGQALPKSVVWIDLIDPTREEDMHVESITGIEIPTREDMREIEESSRLYREAAAHYMTAPLLHSVEIDAAGLQPVTFILAGDRLLTVRYTQPKAFKLFEARVTKPGNELVKAGASGTALMIGLLESVTDRVADLLEDVATRLEKQSDSLFSENPHPMTTPRFRSAMRFLGKEGSFVSKVGESLSGLDRVVGYLGAETAGPKKQALAERLKLIEKDIQSLNRHADFLSGKITFLLDTVVGLVSVEQNAIIKIFSVAAVGFMPPTLVASIYGMNFKFMPELDWTLGYPLALALMLLSAALPLVFFRYKNWL